MIARHTIIRVQTLSKSEYNRSKHIPSAIPSNKVLSEVGEVLNILEPTPLPVVTDGEMNERELLNDGHEAVKNKELHKRAYIDRNSEESPLKHENHLAQELNDLNDEVEGYKREIEYLRMENNNLIEEREFIIKGFEERINIMENQKDGYNNDRRMQALEQENDELKNKIEQFQSMRQGISNHMQALPGSSFGIGDSNVMFDKIVTERDQFEAHLRQAQAIQISLEQELRQKTDEKNKMYSDYEVKLANLQSEIAALKSQKQGDSVRKSQILGTLEEQNQTYSRELTTLKYEKNKLEILVEVLRGEKLNVDSNIKLRLAEVEAANNSNASLLDQERRTNLNLRALLQQKEQELSLRELETTQWKEDTFSPHKSNTQSVEPISYMNVLLMAEIERLQNILTNKTVEMEALKFKYTEDLENIKTMNEIRLKDSLRNEIIQVNHQLQAERAQTQEEIANLKRTVSDYEIRITVLSENLKKADKGGLEQSYVIDNTQTNEKTFVWETPLLKGAEVAKKAGHKVPDASDSSGLIHEKSNFDAVIHDLRLNLAESKTKQVLFMAEIERLGLIMEHFQTEINTWRIRVDELEQERANLLINLQAERENNKQLNLLQDTSNTLTKVEADKYALEAQSQILKSKIIDLENQISFLQRENEDLQQANVNKIMELENWKDKYSQLEKGSNQLRASVENEFRIKQEKDIAELRLKWTQEKQNLEEYHGESYLKLSSLEQDNALLKHEINRLSQTLEKAQAELTNWQKAFAESEQKYKSMTIQVKDQFEASFAHRLEVELLAKSNQIVSERALIENDLQVLRTKINYLEDQIKILTNELESAQRENINHTKNVDELILKTAIIREQQNEVESWKVRYESLQSRQKQEVEDLKLHLDAFYRENTLKEVSENQYKWNTDKDYLQTELNQISNQKRELENRIVLINDDINRLQQLVNNSKNETEQWKLKSRELEQNLTIVKIDADVKTRQIIEKEISEINLKFKVERDTFENELIYLKHVNQDLLLKNVLFMVEIERLGQLITNRDHETGRLRNEVLELDRNNRLTIDDLRRQHEVQLKNTIENGLKEQTDKFLFEKKNYELELNTLVVKNRNLEALFEELKDESHRLEDQLRIKDSEIEKLDKKFNQLQWDHETYVEELKQDIQNQLTDDFENQMKRMNEEFIKERNRLEDQIRNLEGRIAELENDLQDSENINSRNLDDMHEYKTEVEILRSKCEELEKNKTSSLQDLTHKLERQRHAEIQEVVKSSSHQHQQEKSLIEEQYASAISDIKSLEIKINHLNLELDRLSQTNTQKTLDVRELEETIRKMNSQFNVEKSSYDINFNSLNNKLKDVERQNSQLINEINNLNGIITNKTIDVEEARSTSQKINSQWIFEKSSLEDQNRILKEKFETNQLKSVLFAIEIERLSNLNSRMVIELEESKQRYDKHVRETQSNIEQLKFKLEFRHRQEKDESEAQIRLNFDRSRSEYEARIRTVQFSITEYENKIRSNEMEVDRLNVQLRLKSDEIKELRDRSSQIEVMKSQEIERLRETFETEKREFEARQLKDRLEIEREQHKAKIRELKYKINDLENKNTYIAIELEKQNSLYKNQIKEIESWKDKYNKLENSRLFEIDDVKNQVELLKQSSLVTLQISDHEVRFKAERTAYEAQILQYRQKLEELEIQIKDFSFENERINNLFMEKKREVEILRTSTSVQVDQNSLKELERKKREVETLKREKFEFNAAKLRFEVEKKAYENEIAQLQQATNSKKIEIAKLYDLIDTRRTENENLASELTEAREEISRHLKYYKELEGEYLSLNSKYEQLIREAGDLHRSKEIYRSQIDHSQREMAKRNRELIHKIHEVDSLKTKYEEAYANGEPSGTASSKVITRISAVGSQK